MTWSLAPPNPQCAFSALRKNVELFQLRSVSIFLVSAQKYCDQMRSGRQAGSIWLISPNLDRNRDSSLLLASLSCGKISTDQWHDFRSAGFPWEDDISHFGSLSHFQNFFRDVMNCFLVWGASYRLNGRTSRRSVCVRVVVLCPNSRVRMCVRECVRASVCEEVPFFWTYDLQVRASVCVISLITLYRSSWQRRSHRSSTG